MLNKQLIKKTKVIKAVLLQLTIVVISAFNSFGQSTLTLTPGNTYQFTVDTQLKQSDIYGKPIKPRKSIIAKPGYRFILVNIADSAYVVRFLRWESNNSHKGLAKAVTKKATISNANKLNTAKNAAFVFIGNDTTKSNTENGDTTRYKYFIVSKGVLEQRIRSVYRLGIPEIAAGAIVLPVKMRFSPFDFTRDLSIGLSVGPKWRISQKNEHYFYLLGAINVGIVGLDSANTEGVVKKATDKGALGATVGGVFDFKGIQIGLFLGKDWLGRRDRQNWGYQGNTWMSVGLGFSIFSKQNSSGAAVTN